MSLAGQFPTASRDAAFEAADAMIAHTLVARRTALGRPILAGLCGAQGSGKSTTASRLADRLDRHGEHPVILSIDDFYLTRAERVNLGRDIHPLLETRGVPGTHDVGLAMRTIDALLAGSGTVAVPRFDKSRDDRVPADDWPHVRAPASIVILEGWCVGAEPLEAADLVPPINDLERHEDIGGAWRRHMNAALSGPYRRLFQRLDHRTLLRAPDFAHVHAWRLEQEQKLARVPGRSLQAMDAHAITRFIAHYERLTRWILLQEPAELLIDIAGDRTPLAWRTGRGVLS